MSDCAVYCEHGEDVTRDRWGGVIIDKARYRRPSTLSKSMDDQTNLITWRCGMVAGAVARFADLRETALMAEGDSGKVRELVDESFIRGGGQAAANRGSALHEALRRVNLGLDPGEVSPAMATSITAYEALLERYGLHAVSAEQFVVNDKYGTAGTYDIVLEDAQGLRFMCDIKTGTRSWERSFPLPVSIQLAAYQGGKRWCPREGDLPPHGANDAWALLVSVPVDKASAELDVVDLEVGRAGLELANQVMTFRQQKPARPARLPE